LINRYLHRQYSYIRYDGEFEFDFDFEFMS